jgi:hypothetical protein
VLGTLGGWASTGLVLEIWVGGAVVVVAMAQSYPPSDILSVF